MNMLKPCCLVLALMSSQIAFAELNIPGLSTPRLNTLATQDEMLAKTGIMQNDDDITANQSLNNLQLTEQQLHESAVWELTQDEEKRYVLLMQNRSNIYYRGLRQTPLDILGINARTEDERNHFAELAAKQEAQKVSKNIAWNNAFYKAYNKLFANMPVVGDFDPKPFSPYAHKPVQLNQGETLYFFIKPDDAVKSVLMLLIEAVDTTPNTHLNIMLLDSNEVSIQRWANQHQIPQVLVNNGQVTLNKGDLNYQSLTIPKKETPLLLLASHGKSNIVDLGRF
jgi:integrating conjugative element protein (TIGR03759 family)